MSVNTASSQNNKRRRRCIEFCQVGTCTKRAKEELEIEAGIYGLVRLKTCKKCCKLIEAKKTKTAIITDSNTVDIDDEFDEMYGVDFDFRRHSDW